MWASRITSLGLEMALPTIGGYYIDRRFGLSPLLTLLGAGLGFMAGFVHLIQIVKRSSQAQSKP